MSFEKLMKDKKKKGAPEMSDNEQKAKMGVVKDMQDMASGEMGKRLGGLKKVSVMSDSKEGLSKGLDKAKQLMNAIKGSGDASPESVDGEETSEEGTQQEHETHPGGESHAFGGDESPEEESKEEEAKHEAMSSDELDAKIKQLIELKKKKQSEESVR